MKAACLAQLVNALAPSMTETGGAARRQTVFHPFAHMSRHGRGRVLRAQVDCETYAATYCDPRGPLDLSLPIPAAPYVKLAVVERAADSGLTLFALNRDLAQPDRVRLTLRPASWNVIRVARASTSSGGG